jgi:arsenate reductase-like glutaredoxin family protein
MAEQLIKLKADEITIEQLSEWMAKLATEYLLSVKDEAQAYLKATDKPSKDEVV